MKVRLITLGVLFSSSHLLANEAAQTPIAPINTATSTKEVSVDEKVQKVESDDVLAPTYSCSIHFPLDSVRFSEQRIEECFAGIDPKTISYIHVIATATPAGSNKHNLYLSTRRAGALEGYLRNRYPETVIHAFGGGENPKSGKMARIIIVTRTPQKQTREKVVMYKPEIVTKVKEVEKIRYRDRPANGWQVATLTGITNGQSAYQYLGVSAQKDLKIWQLKQVAVGINYRLLRSNRAYDLNETGIFAAKRWQLKRLTYDSLITATATVGGSFLVKQLPGNDDGIAKAGQPSTAYEVGARVDYIKARYVVSGETRYGSLFQSYGIGLGVQL